MTTTNTMRHRFSTYALQGDSFGWDTTEYQLDIWQDDIDNSLFVRVLKDGNPHAAATFRDCETQHHDSERWLNDKIGFPNPFAGILSEQAW